jgi:hypothetical protein
MHKARLVGGILLVIAALFCFVVAAKFNESAASHQSNAGHSARAEDISLELKWAEEDQRQGLYSLVGGIAALILGGVLLSLNLLKEKATTAAPAETTAGPDAVTSAGYSPARVGMLLLIVGVLLGGLSLGLPAKNQSHFVFELSLGGPVVIVLVHLILLAFTLTLPFGRRGSRHRIRTIGIGVLAVFLSVNLLYVLISKPRWYGPEADRPTYRLAYGFYVQALATALVVAGAVCRVQADGKMPLNREASSGGTASS